MNGHSSTMTPAELTSLLKEDAIQGLSKLQLTINSDVCSTSKDADVLGFLTALSELSAKEKGEVVFAQVVDTLLALAKCRHMSKQNLKVWLSAALNLISKACSQGALAVKLVDVMPLFLSYEESELVSNMPSWCQLMCQGLLSEDEHVRAAAVTVLQTQRESILGRRKLAAHMLTAIQNRLVPPLLKWFNCDRGGAALNVWSSVVEFLGDTLCRSPPGLINSVLTIAEKGFRSTSPDIHCLSLDSWKVLIDSMAQNPEKLKLARSLKLLMTPLKSPLSSKVQVRMKGLRTIWYLARRLGESLPDAFEQVGLPLLENVISFLTNEKDDASSEDKHELKTECVHLLLRLLQPPDETDIFHIPIDPLHCSLPITLLSRHIATFEKACHGAFTFLHKGDSTQDEITNLLGHFLIQRAMEAHGVTNIRVVSSILKLIIQSVGKHLSPSTSMKVLQEASQMPEKLLLSHSYYSGKSGVLHGTPALSLMELVFDPVIVNDFCCDAQYLVLFRRLVDVGMESSSWLHFAQGVITLLDRNSLNVPLGPMWTSFAQSLHACVIRNQEVNQGNQLEHDFSALVAALRFPFQHLFSNPHFSSKKGVMKIWTGMYISFACCAALVPTTQPNTSCHVFCHALYASLTSTLKEDITYVQFVCEALVVVNEHISKSARGTKKENGVTPPKWDTHSRQRNSTPLGNLHWYVCALAWCLEATAVAEQKLRESYNTQSSEVKNALLGAAQNSLRLVQEFFQFLRASTHIEEALKLLGPPLAPLFAVTKNKLANKSYASSVNPKLEATLSALVTCTTTHYLGPRDGSLLPVLGPLLESAILHPRTIIHERATQLWQALFGQASTHLNVPSSLREVLEKARTRSLPSFVSVDDCISSQATCSTQDDLFIPDARLPMPAKMDAVVPCFPVKTILPTTPKQKKLRLEEMKDDEFVAIESPSSKRAVLTEHQKEVFRERRPLPALYSNLSQDATNMTSFSETQDTEAVGISEQPHQIAEEAREEVVVLDSDDELTERGEEDKVTIGPDKDAESPNSSEEAGVALSADLEHTDCVVPETQDPENISLVTAEVRVMLGKKIDVSQYPNLKISQQSPRSQPGSSSPKVHKPKRKLSFAQKPSVIVEEEAEAAHLNEDDIVPSSQSMEASTGSSSEPTSSGDIGTPESLDPEDVIEGTQEEGPEEKSSGAKKKVQKPRGKRKMTRIRKKECETESSKQLAKGSIDQLDVAACNGVPEKSSESTASPVHVDLGHTEAHLDDVILPKHDVMDTTTEQSTEEGVGNSESSVSRTNPDSLMHGSEEPQLGMSDSQSVHQDLENAPADSNAESRTRKNQGHRGRFHVRSLKRRRMKKGKAAANRLRKRTGTDTGDVSPTEMSPEGHASDPKAADGEQGNAKAPDVMEPATENNSEDVTSSLIDDAWKSDGESKSSQESSTSLHSPSAPTRVRHSTRTRKRSARVVEAEESDVLLKRAKMANVADTGTKDIKSYFLSVAEEPKQEQDSSWDSLRNVEKELQPEDGVSPLPRDNDPSESSVCFLKGSSQVYGKQSVCDSNMDRQFNALLSRTKDCTSEDCILVSESQQTQPYEVIIHDELPLGSADKELPNHPVISETEETQPCCGSMTEEEVCFNPRSAHSREQEVEDVSLIRDVVALHVANDDKGLQNFECSEQFELAADTVARCIAVSCAPECTPTKEQSTEPRLTKCSPPSSPGAADYDIFKMEETVSSSCVTLPDDVCIEVTTTTTKDQEQADICTIVDDAVEIHRPVEQGTCGDQEQFEKGDTVTTDHSSSTEDKTMMEDKDVASHVVTCPETAEAIAVTESGPYELVRAEQVFGSPSRKVCGAKKRKLPFHYVSPVASRLRSKNSHVSIMGDAGSPANGTSNMPGIMGSPERAASPSKKTPRPGGTSCPSPLSRSQKMVDAAKRLVAELSPSSKARHTHETVRDEDSRSLVGILKKEGLSNGETRSPRRKCVSFADPIIGGVCPIPKLQKRRWKSLDSFYAPKEEDLAEEVIENSQAPLCEQLTHCSEPIEKIVPFITTSTWASGLCHYFEEQNLRTVGDLSSLTPAQALSIPVRPPKVATLQEGLQTYLAVLASPSDTDKPQGNDGKQEQDSEQRDVESTGSEEVCSMSTAGDGMLETEVATSEDEAGPRKRDSQLGGNTVADVDTLCDILIHLTPEVISRLPFDKQLALLDNVVQGLKLGACTEKVWS
ncbi:telomere-associated protein RIF1-like [Ornithodoros turicata]|uniref:telomere-associated protein RIF1-like n=1 Tax=Ornithodoros turicata TaxID=34597 RepID=UPI0031392FDD